MPKKKLNDPYIRNLDAPEKRTEIYDKIVEGMAVRVTPKGHKSFVYRYRFGDKVKRYTIGSYPSWSLADAREKARQLDRKVAEGIDPQQQKKAKKHAPEPQTVSDLAERFKNRHLPTLKESTQKDYRRRIDNVILPALGNIPIDKLSRADIIDLLEEIAEERDAPVQSNRVRTILSSMYSFGVNRAMIDYNPVLSVKPVGQENSRDRVYEEDEIRSLWAAFEQEEQPYEAVFKLLLICGQRAGETRQMKWEHLSDGNWHIPAENTKSGRAQQLPLPDLAQQIIEDIRPLTGKSDYVFLSPAFQNRPIGWLQNAAKRIRLASEVSDFRTHDLRRTAASYMAQLGVDRTVLGKVLNHKGLAGDSQVTAIYDRYEYMDEKEKALNKWSSYLLNSILTSKVGANINQIG